METSPVPDKPAPSTKSTMTKVEMYKDQQKSQTKTIAGKPK